jgi:hypothetical protein
MLGEWPGPRGWRRLHRATRSEVLELAAEGEVHPDEQVAAVALEWARWRSKLSPLRQLGIALLTLTVVQGAIVLAFLLFVVLVPGGETSHDDSLLAWVKFVGGIGLMLWRLVMVPSSAAYDILRMHALGGH